MMRLTSPHEPSTQLASAPIANSVSSAMTAFPSGTSQHLSGLTVGQAREQQEQSPPVGLAVDPQ
jgi:hypothetical protein